MHKCVLVIENKSLYEENHQTAPRKGAEEVFYLRFLLGLIHLHSTHPEQSATLEAGAPALPSGH